LHLVDRLVERRRARRQPDRPHGGEPCGIQVIGAFDVEGRRVVLPAHVDQPARVVRVPTAHDDDGVDAVDEVDERLLPQSGRPADGVDDPDVGVGVEAPDAGRDVGDQVRRRRGLTDDAEARTGVVRDVVHAADDVVAVEILDDAADLDMPRLADQQHVPALGLQGLRGVMRTTDQRAGRVDQRLVRGRQALPLRVADAVRRDQHHRRPGGDGARLLRRLPEAGRVEPPRDPGVMHEFAVDRDLRRVAHVRGGP
jgi:hypothetical protein